MTTLREAVKKHFLDMDISEEVVIAFVKLLEHIDSEMEGEWDLAIETHEYFGYRPHSSISLEDLLQFYDEAWQFLDPLLITNH